MISPVFLYLIMQTFSSKSVNRDLETKKVYLIIFAIIMTLMIGLRSRYVGSTDTIVYFNNWKIVQRISFSELGLYLETIDMEKGYLIFSWILSHIFKDPQMLLVISAAFFSISICRFVYINCENPALALLVFNCLGLFNFMVQGLRQGMAMCICLFALEMAKQDKKVKFILLVLLASTFHASAIVFFAILILKFFKIQAFDMTIFFLSAALGINMLPKIFEIMNKAINDNYDMSSGAEKGGIVAIFIYMCIIAFSLLFRDKDDSRIHLFVYMALIGVSALLIRNNYSTISERIGHYFGFAQMPLIANNISTLEDKNTKIIIAIIVVGLCFGVAMYKSSYSVVIPYTFFWQE